MAGLRAVQAVACGCGAPGKLDALIQRPKPEVGIGVGTVTRVFVEPEVPALTAKFAGVALLALIQSGQYVSEPSYHEAADELIAIVDTFAEPMNDYLNMQGATIPENPYGPTAISSFLAMMHLEHALAYPDHDFDKHIDRTDEIITNIHTAAWSDELGAYRYMPEVEKKPPCLDRCPCSRAHGKIAGNRPAS